MTLAAQIERDILTDYTELTITIKVPKQDEVDCPPIPREAAFGDDWICLQDVNVLEEMGYWALEPEGTPMMLLRYAWIAAHAEYRAKHNSFDGEAGTSWDKAQR